MRGGVLAGAALAQELACGGRSGRRRGGVRRAREAGDSVHGCVAGGRAPEQITTRPITGIDAVDFDHARQLGCTIRQVSHAEWDGQGCLHAAVRPALVSRESALARVAGSQNIVVLRGHYGGETVLSGSGAGGGPTSVAVVSDIAAIARQGPEENRTCRCARRHASAASSSHRTTCASLCAIGRASSRGSPA